AIEVLDGRGEAMLRVTAPAAYAEGGRPVATSLAAAGTRVDLWVDAGAEAVLVDPGWKQAADMSRQRAEHTATLLADGRVLVAGGYGGGYGGVDVRKSGEL